MEDHVYIVGIRLERVVHNIYVWTHNTYPQHMQKYMLWVNIVYAYIYIVDDMCI